MLTRLSTYVKKWMEEKFSRQEIIFGLFLSIIMFFGMVIRFHNIGGKAIIYDEGLHAYHSWRLANQGLYGYEGARHGPPLYYISAFIGIFTDITVILGRQIIASLSIILLTALWPLRRRFDYPTLIFSAIIFSFHPILLWTSRFYQNDILTAMMLLAVISFLSFYEMKRTKAKAVFFGVIIILAAAPKEIGYLIIPMFLFPLLMISHFEAKFRNSTFRSELNKRIKIKHVPWVLTGGVIAFFLIYSGVPFDPLDGISRFIHAMLLWVNRGSGWIEVTFYLEQFIQREPFILTLSGIGIISTAVSPKSSEYRWYVIGYLISASMLLSIHSHQNEELLTIIFVPMVLVAGFAFTDILKILYTHIISPGKHPNKFFTSLMIALIIIIASFSGTPAMNLPGLTEDPEPDNRAEISKKATEIALNKNCDILVGKGISTPWPYWWFFTPVDTVWPPSTSEQNVTFLNENFKNNITLKEKWPAVVINDSQVASIHRWENSSVIQKNTWYLYIPTKSC